MYAIYKVTNTVNGHSYIGQQKYDKDVLERSNYLGSGILIKLAVKKYGKAFFKKEILYSRVLNKKTIDSLEVYAIAKERLNGHCEHNISKGGTGGRVWGGEAPGKGRHPSEETRRKMSLSNHHDSNRHEYNVYHWNAWVRYNEYLLKVNNPAYYKHPRASLRNCWKGWLDYNISILRYNHYKANPGGHKLKGRVSPTKGMHWYKSLDEKQYGMFRECPKGWVKTNPREVNKCLRKGK